MTGLVAIVVVALLWGVVLATAAERGVRRLTRRPLPATPPPRAPASAPFRGRATRASAPAATTSAAGATGPPSTWLVDTATRAAVPPSLRALVVPEPDGPDRHRDRGARRAVAAPRREASSPVRARLAVVDGDRAAGGWWQQLRRQRERRWRDLQVVAQLPDVVDLLRLTTSAGLPVALALKVVGDRPGGPVGQAFRRSAIRLRRGAALADVLPQLTVTCGEPARSLVDALVDHDRYGTPLGPALDRLAIESRLKRRRQAEEAARRLPVVLLFPLVVTSLPAFLLLAVVPLVAGSLAALGR